MSEDVKNECCYGLKKLDMVKQNLPSYFVCS